MRKRIALYVAAAAGACALVGAGEAKAQVNRRSAADSSMGLTVVVGSSDAALCYERARSRSASAEALAVCDAAMSGALSSRNRTATYVNRSIVHAQRGELSEALDDLEQARERRPELPAIHVNFGDVYLRLGQWDQAEAAFTRAIDLGLAQLHIAYYGRGIAREEMDDLEGAYADYSAARDYAPTWDLPRRELDRFRVAPASDAGGA